MLLWQYIPIALVLLPLGLSSLSAVLKPKAARALYIAVNGACLVMSCVLTYFIMDAGELTVKMGEVGAPFGNELYVSGTECAVLVLFNLVMLLSVLAGLTKVTSSVMEPRRALFFTVSQLLLAAVNAIALTNDLFTGYVFLEICTIAAAALIVARSWNRAIFAATRYMIMNLLGSGLFLFGVSMLYALTGELLFPQIKQGVTALVVEGSYVQPLTISIILMAMGLSVKSALYPFHTWLPNAYSGSTPAASSMLSSIVSKAYIFLLIKIIMRGTGLDAFGRSGAANVLMGYAAFAIVLGSVDAIREHNVRRMVSYSSVAQIGYIYMSVALATRAGMEAAVFQIIAHSCAKAMLFPAVDRLTEVSDGHEDFRSLRGSGYRAPVAGLAFCVGAFSITGIPLLGGFAAKVYIAEAAFELSRWRMWLALAVLGISMVLNVTYFLRTVITIYRKSRDFEPVPAPDGSRLQSAALTVFMAANVLLGVCPKSVMNLIYAGVSLWK